MRVCDFFSGIGGFSLGLERVGFKTVAFSEIDPYACAVLRKHWPDVPNLGDIRTLEPGTIPDADLWCDGFPCQPFSSAGARRGTTDRRHLWPKWFRLICGSKPRWLLLENVPTILSVERGAMFGELLRGLASSGYDVEWDCLPASAFGAKHRRERIWIVATRRGNLPDAERDSNSQSQQGTIASPGEHGEAEEEAGRWRISSKPIGESDRAGDVCDSNGLRELQPKGSLRDEWGRTCNTGWWDVEPDVGRVAHGVPSRVDRLRCLGNAIVPQIASWIGERILEVERNK